LKLVTDGGGADAGACDDPVGGSGIVIIQYARFFIPTSKLIMRIAGVM
jgi:hypothetical protein